jgi:hypothetical protein
MIIFFEFMGVWICIIGVSGCFIVPGLHQMSSFFILVLIISAGYLGMWILSAHTLL